MAAAAPTPIGREVFVHIIVDKAELRVEPKRFWVSKAKSEEVVWHCTSTDPNDPYPNFTVDFDKKNGSPFYEKQFRKDCPCSGLVQRDVEPTERSGLFYEYTVRVGTKSLDPDGGVTP